MNFKLYKKSEWFSLDYPIGEPSQKWDTKEKYFIERSINTDGDILWFGIDTNWKKSQMKNGQSYQ